MNLDVQKSCQQDVEEEDGQYGAVNINQSTLINTVDPRVTNIGIITKVSAFTSIFHPNLA
ncbi:hypothetical protein STEG23_018688, partial [Scotinomys teguina]